MNPMSHTDRYGLLLIDGLAERCRVLEALVGDLRERNDLLAQANQVLRERVKESSRAHA
jgi:hypothetical protein